MAIKFVASLVPNFLKARSTAVYKAQIRQCPTLQKALLESPVRNYSRKLDDIIHYGGDFYTCTCTKILDLIMIQIISR